MCEFHFLSLLCRRQRLSRDRLPKGERERERERISGWVGKGSQRESTYKDGLAGSQSGLALIFFLPAASIHPSIHPSVPFPDICREGKRGGKGLLKTAGKYICTFVLYLVLVQSNLDGQEKRWEISTKRCFLVKPDPKF